jgi:hypothetical protein
MKHEKSAPKGASFSDPSGLSVAAWALLMQRLPEAN